MPAIKKPVSLEALERMVDAAGHESLAAHGLHAPSAASPSARYIPA